jgi:hypothetical protein
MSFDSSLHLKIPKNDSTKIFYIRNEIHIIAFYIFTLGKGSLKILITQRY